MITLSSTPGIPTQALPATQSMQLGTPRTTAATHTANASHSAATNHSSGAHAVVGNALLATSSTKSDEEKGSILLPFGISAAAGTVGWLLGGLWTSLLMGAAGYVVGELSR